MIPDPLWLKNPDGVYLACNVRFEELFGVPEAELIGRTDYEFVPAAAADELRAQDLAAIAAKCPIRIEEWLTFTVGGYQGLFETVKTPLYDDQGNMIGVIGIAHDITSQRQVEKGLIQELHQAEQRWQFAVDGSNKLNEEELARRTRELADANESLERALRMKDEFLTCMSHELRTSLTVIIGQAEILAEEIHGALNGTQQKAVRSVESSGRHLLMLINDILDLSKIEAAMLELYPETISVEMLCSACLMFVKHDANRKRLAVSMTIDPSVTNLRADPRRIKQILVNLLVNAVKFTSEGGAVGLEVFGDWRRCQLSFTVWDTGIGIAAGDLDRLFQPFVQVDSRLTRQYDGTGLGLALVERLARLHDGRVAVTSEVGKGSRFTVTLPWEENATNSNSVAPMPGEVVTDIDSKVPLPEAPLILVVDDSPATVEMMQGYFRNSNYRVTAVASGKEAVSRARSGRPSLILMDIQMPGMDGLEAIRRIRRLSGPVARVPIIALTALAMQGDRERCLVAGADEYLSKPVSMTELKIQIRKLLGSTTERNSHD
jgi:PAS domain S-box-containing protein